MKGDIFQYMLHMLRVKFTATTCTYTNQNDKICTSSLLSTMKMEHLLKNHAQEMEHLSSLDFTIFISTSIFSLNFLSGSHVISYAEEMTDYNLY